VLLSVLPTKAANILVMHNREQINAQIPHLLDQKLLMLRSGSFSEWGSDHVVYFVAKKGCQYVGYG